MNRKSPNEKDLPAGTAGSLRPVPVEFRVFGFGAFWVWSLGFLGLGLTQAYLYCQYLERVRSLEQVMLVNLTFDAIYHDYSWMEGHVPLTEAECQTATAKTRNPTASPQ